MSPSSFRAFVEYQLLPTMFFAPVVDGEVRARASDHIYLQLQHQGPFEDSAPGHQRSKAALDALRDD